MRSVDFCATRSFSSSLVGPASDDGVEILPYDHLGSDVFRLHIAKRDGHDTTITGVVNVAAHGGLIVHCFTLLT